VIDFVLHVGYYTRSPSILFTTTLLGVISYMHTFMRIAHAYLLSACSSTHLTNHTSLRLHRLSQN